MNGSSALGEISRSRAAAPPTSPVLYICSARSTISWVSGGTEVSAASARRRLPRAGRVEGHPHPCRRQGGVGGDEFGGQCVEPHPHRLKLPGVERLAPVRRHRRPLSVSSPEAIAWPIASAASPWSANHRAARWCSTEGDPASSGRSMKSAGSARSRSRRAASCSPAAHPSVRASSLSTSCSDSSGPTPSSRLLKNSTASPALNRRSSARSSARSPRTRRRLSGSGGSAQVMSIRCSCGGQRSSSVATVVCTPALVTR